MKNYGLRFLKYIATTLVPVFLGSFVFAGALITHSNNDSLNKTIIEATYRPSKEKFRECSHDHNRWFLAEHELASVYAATRLELQFLIANGNKPLPLEYPFLASGLHEKQKTLREEIERLESGVLRCYETLYSYLEDMALLLGVSEEVRAIAATRAERFNLLHAEKSKKAKVVLKGINPDFVLKAFRMGTDTILTEQPATVLDTLETLSEHMQLYATEDKRIFDMERKAYSEVNAVTSEALRRRLETSFWSSVYR